MGELKIEYVGIAEINEYENNAKEHPDWQVDQIVESIKEFGNCDPIGVWTNPDGRIEVVEGHGRLMALRKLGEETAPVIHLDHLSDEQRRAYGIVHNQTTMNTSWDFSKLENELDSFSSLDMSSFGFSDVELPNIDDLFVDDDSDGDNEKSSKTITCPHCGEIIEL